MNMPSSPGGCSSSPGLSVAGGTGGAPATCVSGRGSPHWHSSAAITDKAAVAAYSTVNDHWAIVQKASGGPTTQAREVTERRKPLKNGASTPRASASSRV